MLTRFGYGSWLRLHLPRDTTGQEPAIRINS